MKLVGIISTAVLFVLLGINAPAYAEQHEEQAQAAKPAPHAQQKQEARQAKSSQRADQKQEGRQAKSSQRAEQKQEGREAKSSQRAEQKQEGREAKSSQRAQRGEHAQRQEYAQRGERGGRIPDDRFRAHFGREHRFRINRPTMVAGHRRFRYGGYWFGFADPWPVGWYYTDEVYVDYVDGGYYLCNPMHPGIRIGISVVL